MTQQCENTGEGFTPIPDMGAAETYSSHLGRLYEDSGTPTNTIPAGHASALASAAAAIERLDSDGDPAVDGKIVVLSEGMSNANQKFAEFVRVASGRAADVVLVNGAQSNRPASAWVAGGTDVWDTIDDRLAAKGVTAAQVQCIWMEHAIGGPSGDFATHLAELKGYLKTIVQENASRFPNCQLIFISTRTYGGYGTTTSPEPYAYESGFAVRDLILDQTGGGDVDLAVGTVPAMAWGPYWWADGETANGADLQWFCDDFESDGIHPAGDDDGVSAPDGAEHKCAALLLDFFGTSPYTADWFLPGAEPTVVATLASNSAASSFATSSYTPTADVPQFVCVFSRAGVAAAPNAPTASGHGITYALEGRRVFSTEASPRAQVAVLRGVGSSPSAGALTVDFGGQSQAVCNVLVVEVDGVYGGGVSAADGVVQSVGNSADAVASLDVTMGAETVEALMLGVFGNVIGASMDEGSGWTELAEVEPAGTPLGTMQVQFIEGYDSPASSSRNGAGTMNFGGFVLGLRTPPPLFLLEVAVSGPGTVSSSPAGISACGGTCEAEFSEDVEVTLTATPSAGFAFGGWSGDFDSADGVECSVTMDGAKSIAALFTVVPLAGVRLGGVARVLVGDRFGRVLGEIEPMVAGVSWRLNGVGVMDFSVPVSSASGYGWERLLRFGNVVLVVFDNGLPNWGGVIDPPRDWQGGRIGVRAYDGGYLLGMRLTDRGRYFDGASVGYIFEKVIEEAKSFWPLLIEVGEVWYGGDGHSPEYHFHDLLEIVERSICGRLSGADFVVRGGGGAGRIWFEASLYEQLGTTRPGVALVEDVNVRSLRLLEQGAGGGGRIVNWWEVVGEGTTWGDDRPIVTVRDEASIERFGLRMGCEIFPNTVNVGTLAATADELLAGSRQPAGFWDLDVINLAPGLFGGYGVGDVVRLVAPSFGFAAGADAAGSASGFGRDVLVRVLGREWDGVGCRLVVEEVRE